MRFIYVMNPIDKDKLLKLGYNILKEDVKNSVYVFENKGTMNFSSDNIQYILSDTLTF